MRERRQLMFVLTLVALCGAYAVSQASEPASSDPVKRLGFYVGNWTEEGKMRAEPTGEFVPLTGHETCKWLKGDFAVQCDETVDSKAGSSVATYLLGYDAIAMHYIVFGIDDGGNILSGDGRLEGDEWTWTGEVNDGKATSRWQYVFRPGPNSVRTMQASLATSDTEWARMQETTYSSLAHAPASTSEEQLRSLEQEWVNAEVHRDAVALRRILDENFIATVGSGSPIDREAFIHAVVSDTDTDVSQTLSDSTIVTDGDTAVVIGTDTVRASTNGVPHTQTYRYTATYIRRGGRWIALAEHLVRMPEPK